MNSHTLHMRIFRESGLDFHVFSLNDMYRIHPYREKKKMPRNTVFAEHGSYVRKCHLDAPSAQGPFEGWQTGNDLRFPESSCALQVFMKSLCLLEALTLSST